MIERLITWSARNPFLIGLMTLLLIAGGVIAMLRTPLDALPRIDRDLTRWELYSRENGNYRDINQNRRCDVWFHPNTGDENLLYFFNLIAKENKTVGKVGVTGV